VNRTALVIAVSAVFGVAACGTDDSSESFGSGAPVTTPTPTDVAITSPASVPSSDAPTDTAAGTVPQRPTTSAAPTAPLTQPIVGLSEVGSFDQPVEITDRPGDATLYVVEQPGRVVAVTDLASETVLDLTDLTDANGEQGLLGLAFHPTADLAYAYFTDNDGDTVVAEFGVDPTTGALDRDTLREVLTVEQPYANHNGGELAFGPDQLLYIGLGDGGSGGDPDRSALDLSSRLGKILRIDPVESGDQPFSVPADNPFVDTPGADPTIWSYGLRNPWRFSFDPDSGDLWIADVGQGDFEEINRSVATDGRDAGRGVNYGWSAFEGFESFNADQPTDGAVAPLFVYDHADGRCSVTGGAVARGDAVPDLRGWYVFGDYCSGQIWVLDPTAPPEDPRVIEIAELGGLASIAVGPDRDIYAVSNGGTVARLIPG
jgi:glucose/arabinose dehydrogenase